MTNKIILFLLSSMPNLVFAMNAAQKAAFTGANAGSSSFTGAQSTFVIAAVASVLVMIWFVWVTLSSYQAWASNSMTGNDAGSNVLRALFVMLITLVIVSY